MSTRSSIKLVEGNRGSGVASILNPVNGIREQQLRDGKKPVNHAAINRAKLKETEEKTKMKLIEQQKKQAQEPFKMARFKNVESIVAKGGGTREGSGSNSPTSNNAGHSFLRKNEGKSVASKGVEKQLQSLSMYSTSKHQQRNEADDYSEDEKEEQDYNSDEEYRGRDEEEESIGGLMNSNSNSNQTTRISHSHHNPNSYHQNNHNNNKPSLKLKQSSLSSSPASRIHMQTKPSVPRADELISSSSSSSRPVSNKNYIASNTSVVIQQSQHQKEKQRQKAEEEANNTGQHSNYGKIPSYIEERKAELAAKKEKEKQEKEKEKLPIGMKKMEEEERIRTVQILKINLEKVNNDLSAFPLRVETISRKRAKEELESKIMEIEEAIKTFSKKVVYITDE